MSGISGVSLAVAPMAAPLAAAPAASTPSAPSSAPTATSAPSQPTLSTPEGGSLRDQSLRKAGEDLVALALLALLLRPDKNHGMPEALTMAMTGAAIQAFNSIQSLGGAPSFGQSLSVTA